MSPVGQSILMALTVTVNKFNSSNVQAVHRNEAPKPTTHNRRGLILVLSAVTAVAATPQPQPQPQLANSSSQLLRKYLKKSEENKAKNDKERLDSYYKRNYKDYFEFVEGGLKGKNEEQLSETEKGILDWLKSNK